VWGGRLTWAASWEAVKWCRAHVTMFRLVCFLGQITVQSEFNFLVIKEEIRKSTLKDFGRTIAK
jgi:hypothetical protein